MKVMRSTREGSSCADCGAKIKVDDPIAYFGPGRVYGLTCHTNDKTQKHLEMLLKLESKLVEGRADGTTDPPRNVDRQQEWVVRVELSSLGTLSAEDIPASVNVLKWLMKGRYCGQLSSALNIVEFRAPRNIALPMTKTWAESFAKEVCPLGKVEVAPLWGGITH